MYKKNGNKKLYLFVDIIILIISIIISTFYNIEELSINYEKNLFILGWIINVLFLWDIYSIYKIKRNILDFNIIFLIFLFVFCNGQTFLYTLGVPIKKLSVIKIASSYQIMKEIIYFYFSLLFFQIGSMLCINSNNDNIEDINDNIFKKSIKIFAYMLAIISVIPYVYILLPKIKLSVQLGYKALYTNSTSISGVIGYIAKMFIPSLIMLLYSYKNNKKIAYFIIGVLSTIAFVNVFIGARGDGLSIIVIILVFYGTCIQKFEKGKILKLAIIVLLIMIVIPIAATFRTQENKSISAFVNEIQKNITSTETNFLVKTISELGYTMHSFILTDEVVPNIVDYKYGESYIASIMMIIPSKLMGGYSFANSAALDIWLQDIHNMSYGPGFSIVAETYYNFGFYGGIVFIMVIGFVYSKVLNMHSNKSNKNTLLKLLSLVFLYNSLLVARFPFHNTVRNIVYMYIIPYLSIILIYNTITRKERN
ncbi:MAG: O-antigen polysaccharide polymerase Wzy [Clostridia bacterium]